MAPKCLKPYKYIDNYIYINYIEEDPMKRQPDFEWDSHKDRLNQKKHGVSFSMAQHAFLDSHRIILQDLKHSKNEKRYYCIGKIAGGILTVRFTYRNEKIRIMGAGYWRKGKSIYEKENQIHE